MQILTKPCVECGGKIELHYNDKLNEKLTLDQVCFTCNFWREYVERKDDHNIARIKGVHWYVNPMKSTSRWNGMGGRKFIIRWKDSTIQRETNDLWCQGAIPPHFASRLPDNAEFVHEE